MMIPRIPDQPTGARHRRAVGRSRDAEGDRLTATDVVGFGHIILGALGVVSAGVSIIFMGAFTLEAAGASLLLLTVAGLTVLAGLWIRDGHRRGAILAAGLDVCRLAVLVLAGSLGVDMVLTIALLIGAIWVLPMLSSSSSPT